MMHRLHTALLCVGVLSLIGCNQAQDVEPDCKTVELCFGAELMDIEAEAVPTSATRSTHTTQQDAAFQPGATFSVIAFDYSDAATAGITEREAAHYVMYSDGIIRRTIDDYGVCSHDWKRLRVFAISPDLMQFTQQGYVSSDVYVQEDQTTPLGEQLSDWIVGTDDNEGVPFQPLEGTSVKLKCHHLFSKILLTVSVPADTLLVGKTVTPVISNVVQRAHVNLSTAMSKLHYRDRSYTDYYFQYMFEHTTGQHIISKGIRMADYEITRDMVDQAEAANTPIIFQCSCIVLPDVGSTGYHYRPNFHVELTTPQADGSSDTISTDTIGVGFSDYEHYRSTKRYKYSVSVSPQAFGLTGGTPSPVSPRRSKGEGVVVKRMD